MRKLIVSSALALIALAGITGTARADDYNGSCANVPASVDGNIFLSEPDCEIDHAISATGDIVFNYGTVSAKGMTAGGHIDLNTTSFTGDGNISAQGYVRIRSENDIAIDGDVATVTAGSVRLEASGNVSVNNVTSAPDSHIIIYSNYNTGNSGKFYIGGSGHSNGINGTATSEYALYVYNGFGGIEVVDPTKITVRALLLNALDDAIKISSGLLSTDAYNDGTIQLLADSIEFESGAILSSKNSDSSGQVHGIALNAKNITYDGDLTLNADGDGTSGRHGYVYFFTKGSTTINLLGSIYNPFIDIDNTNAVVDELTVTGTGSGTLNVTANGNYMDVVLQGYPIAFNTAGDINMFAKASVGHGIYVRNLNNRNDQAGVAFAGSTGKVMLDASGDGGNGGTVEISADNILLDQDRFDIKVDGPEGGSGNGGTINLSGTRIAQSQTKSAFSANGAGSGNGGLILIAPGESNLNVGENLADAGSVGVVYLAAKGGDTSGNGGLVKVYDMTGDLTVNGSKADTKAIDVSVAGPAGDGGTIDLQIDGDILFKPKDAEGDAGFVANSGITDGKGGSILLKAKGFEANDVSVKFQANGVDTGAGGTIDVQLEESLFIAYGIGAYSFEARNTDASADWLNGNADGGTIKITSEDELSLYGGALGVDGGHKGGNLLIKGDSLFISGNFYANGGAQGDGGQIKFESNSLTWQDENENTKISADGYGEGDGGVIEIKVTGTQGVVIGDQSQALKVNAQGGDSGNGGQIHISSAGELIVYGEGVTTTPTAGGNGDGGEVKIISTDAITMIGELNVSGEGAGNGGVIEITGSSVDLSDSSTRFTANGGSEGGGGGSVTLNNAEFAAEFLTNQRISVMKGPQLNTISRKTLDTAIDGRITRARNGASVTCVDKSPPPVVEGADPKFLAWDCTNAQNGTQLSEKFDAQSQDFKDKFSNSIKTRLRLFTFDNRFEMIIFFDLVAGNVSGISQGYTAIYEKENDGNIMNINVSVYPNSSYAVETKSEIAAHELGHALDQLWSVDTSFWPSENEPFTKALRSDLLSLDYATIGSSKFLSLARDPCDPADGAPLAGLKDHLNSGAEICVNGVLADSRFANMTNSKILKLTDNLGMFAPNENGAFREWFAQLMGWENAVLGHYAAENFDMLYNNPYGNHMSCTKGYASQMLTGNPIDYNNACTLIDQTWYNVFDDK